MVNLELFLRSYAVTALWSSTDDNGEPLDADYGVEDIAPDAMQAMREDCADFIAGNAKDLSLYADKMAAGEWSQDEQAGHDFWLTRNRHGAGFWDRGIGDVGERLTKAAHAYGETNLYIGDDGLVHIM